MGLCGCVQANSDASADSSSNCGTRHHGSCWSNQPNLLYISAAKLSSPDDSTGICRLVGINGECVHRRTHKLTVILLSSLDFYRDLTSGRKCLHPSPVPGTTLGKTGLAGERESQR